MNKDKVLVLAYPGSGKTYLADNFKNVSDIEFQHFRWDYGEYKTLPLEKLKGRKDIRTPRPDWPDNFFKQLEIELENNEIILLPMSTTMFDGLDRINRAGVRIIFAMPRPEKFEELEKTFEKRGNSKEFIESRRNDFQKYYDITQNCPYEKVFIEKDEHLYDALTRIGIKFEKGKGYKNYF